MRQKRRREQRLLDFLMRFRDCRIESDYLSDKRAYLLDRMIERPACRPAWRLCLNFRKSSSDTAAVVVVVDTQTLLYHTAMASQPWLYPFRANGIWGIIVSVDDAGPAMIIAIDLFLCSCSRSTSASAAHSSLSKRRADRK